MNTKSQKRYDELEARRNELLTLTNNPCLSTTERARVAIELREILSEQSLLEDRNHWLTATTTKIDVGLFERVRAAIAEKVMRV